MEVFSTRASLYAPKCKNCCYNTPNQNPSGFQHILECDVKIELRSKSKKQENKNFREKRKFLGRGVPFQRLWRIFLTQSFILRRLSVNQYVCPIDLLPLNLLFLICLFCVHKSTSSNSFYVF